MSSARFKHSATPKSVLAMARFVTALLGATVFAAHAMTLGDIQGEALIGRQLDLRVPVQSTEGDALSEACVRASISYGETPQKSLRLSIQNQQLRLQLSEPVNEPIVKVELRTICGAMQIRNYVLLADLPPEINGAVTVTVPSASAATQPVQSSSPLVQTELLAPQGAVTAGATSTSKPDLTRSRKPASSLSQGKKIAKKQKAIKARSLGGRRDFPDVKLW